jgi:hypothetical protein
MVSVTVAAENVPLGSEATEDAGASLDESAAVVLSVMQLLYVMMH